jgi:hypothetical protein
MFVIYRNLNSLFDKEGYKNKQIVLLIFFVKTSQSLLYLI